MIINPNTIFIIEEKKYKINLIYFDNFHRFYHYTSTGSLLENRPNIIPLILIDEEIERTEE